jgi:hypothetical protein
MQQIKVPLRDKNGFISISKIEDFEYVNPIEKDKDTVMKIRVQMTLNNLQLSRPDLYQGLKIFPNLLTIIQKDAAEYADKLCERMRSVVFPAQLNEILFSRKKKIQSKLLDGLKLESDQLQSFIYSAWENHGFYYSMYTADYPPKGINDSEMPRIAVKRENNTVEIFGGSTYSEAEIRRVIEQRKSSFAKFLDKDDLWHCFFYSYNSIGGRESGGISHIHYISSAFGLPRDFVLKQLKSDSYYQLPSTPHIPYSRHPK